MQITEYLLDNKKITDEDFLNASKTQNTYGGDIGEILVRLGAIDEITYFKELAKYLDIKLLTFSDIPPINIINETIEKLDFSLDFLLSNNVVIFPHKDIYLLASPNPISSSCSNILSQIDKDVELSLITNDMWEQIKDNLKTQTKDRAENDDLAYLREIAEQAPIIDFVNNMFAVALEDRASDIHIEPFAEYYVIRMRIDGILHEWRKHTKTNFQAIVSRLKLLSGMDISQQRIPQDGRQSIRVANKEIDLRVSSLPSSWGESLVLRLLVKSTTIPSLGQLGMTDDQALKFKDLIEKPNGILLITGPTGSGKTTTIYRLIDQLNNGTRKIITIEDPVEYDIKGVMQMQVHEQIGLTFASGLRSILRQDPDIVVIGEIRDVETAKIAVQAALTGHLVISTLHTNSALAAIPRLQDLGLENFLIADVLIGFAGQRLGRRLCEACSEPLDKNEVKEICKELKLPVTKGNWRKPKGCVKCHNTGYRGRFSILEIYDTNSDLRSLIRNQSGLDEMEKIMTKAGYFPMYQDGILKAKAGITNIEEVWRVIGK